MDSPYRGGGVLVGASLRPTWTWEVQSAVGDSMDGGGRKNAGSVFENGCCLANRGVSGEASPASWLLQVAVLALLGGTDLNWQTVRCCANTPYGSELRGCPMLGSLPRVRASPRGRVSYEKRECHDSCGRRAPRRCIPPVAMFAIDDGLRRVESCGNRFNRMHLTHPAGFVLSNHCLDIGCPRINA